MVKRISYTGGVATMQTRLFSMLAKVQNNLLSLQMEKRRVCMVATLPVWLMRFTMFTYWCMIRQQRNL